MRNFLMPKRSQTSQTLTKPEENGMPQLSRRAFASALPLGLVGGTLFGGSLLGDLTAQAATSKATGTPVVTTPFAQIHIGRFTVTALTDGYADMPYNYFRDARPPKWKRPQTPSLRADPAGFVFCLINTSLKTVSNAS